MDSRDVRILVAVVLAFAGSRLLWLAWNPESAAYWEESQRWMAAHEILAGPRQPLFSYQADHYQGGPLAISLAIVPIFAVLGESIFTLKLVALLTSTATLCALYGVARIGAGRSTAVLAGASYVTGPPLVAYWGLVPFGSHGESTLFTLASFGLLLVLLSDRRSVNVWLAFGVVGGLGIWFCYTTAIGLAACAVTWLSFAGLPRGRELGAAAVGAGMGLLPWLAYNLAYDFPGWVRILQFYGLGDPVDAWAPQGLLSKLVALVTHDLPWGLMLPAREAADAPWGTILVLGFAIPLYAGLLLAGVRGVRGLSPLRAGTGASRAGALELLLVSYAIIHVLVYGLSHFVVWHEDGPVAYRLFLPLGVVLCLLFATGIEWAYARGARLRVAAVVLAASFLTASASGTLLLASRPDDPDHPVGLGSGYFVHGVLLHRKHEDDLNGALAWLEGLPEGRARAVLIGMGVGMEYRFAKDARVDALRQQLALLEPAERAPVLIGIWRGIGFHADSWQIRRWRGEETTRDRLFLPNLVALTHLVREEAARIPAGAWPTGRSAPPRDLLSIPEDGRILPRRERLPRRGAPGPGR